MTDRTRGEVFDDAVAAYVVYRRAMYARKAALDAWQASIRAEDDAEIRWMEAKRDAETAGHDTYDICDTGEVRVMDEYRPGGSP
jgi:hypothetical protein